MAKEKWQEKADGYSFCDTRLDKHGDKGGAIILEVID